MFRSTTNIQKFSTNLKPLLRSKTVECVTTLFNNKQQNRFSSSNDGDRVDEQFDYPNTTTTTSTTKQSSDENEKDTSNNKQSIERNVNNNKSQFISIEIFVKDARLPLPGNIGFADKYSKTSKNNNTSSKSIKESIEKEFQLISDHNPLSKDCLTTTIDFNLNNYETNEDRQNRIVENVIYNYKDELSLERNQNKYKSLFMIKVHSSTQFLLNDIKQLFPKECLFEKDFVIITVYKNPLTDFTDVDVRDEFLNLANSIAESLNKLGCWVNFQVPDGKRSIADLAINLDTDNRFINYGVEIEDHADCKLINHINNTKLFIGTVFTSAKLNSVELNRVLNYLTPV